MYISVKNHLSSSCLARLMFFLIAQLSYKKSKSKCFSFDRGINQKEQKAASNALKQQLSVPFWLIP